MTTSKPEKRYEVRVTYIRTTGKHYKGEKDVFNVRAVSLANARTIIRRQLRGQGAKITSTVNA